MKSDCRCGRTNSRVGVPSPTWRGEIITAAGVYTRNHVGRYEFISSTPAGGYTDVEDDTVKINGEDVYAGSQMHQTAQR